MKTAEQIAAIAERDATTEQGAIRIINREYRRQDESHLWPIRGRFNVTERAIRQARAFMRDCGSLEPLEYAYTLDSLLSEIVNDEGNW
jgi:hypothetical protein